MNRTLVNAYLLVGSLLVAIAIATEGGGDSTSAEAPTPERTIASAARADPVPYDGRSPRLVGGGTEERVLLRLPRPALGERPDLDTLDAGARREYVASLEREAQALRSALTARGVELRDVATFELAWHGFAATVRASDLTRLGSLGVRTRPVRRFYPATSEPVVLGERAAPPAEPPPADRAPIAVLAGGVDSLDPGYDAVERDLDPAPATDPRHPGRTETSGDLLGRMLAALGERVLPIRVAALRAAPGGVEEFGLTDELLAGLERAVDPNGDGDTTDHVPVALVGVSAPYAGFAGAPEAEAVAGAGRLGTLVVGPAGHEGSSGSAHGTIGSPGASAHVTAGALSLRDGVGRAELRVGDVAVAGAALLGGRPPTQPLATAGPFVGVVDPAMLLQPGVPPVAGKAAIVQPGADPVANAAAAAAAGAAAVVIAEPRGGRVLPAMPAGRIPAPVIGVTGAGARAVLAAGTGHALQVVKARLPDIPPDSGLRAQLSRFSSRGPTQRGLPKPDVALTGATRDGATLAGGTAVAAARAAARAAAVARAVQPPLGVDALAARLAQVGMALPGDSGRIGVEAGSGADLGRSRPVPVGRPRLARAEGRISGVRFTVGDFDRGDPPAGVGTRMRAAERLELVLERADGSLVRRLTPPGGERGLLPGEFAYTLPAELLDRLDAGRYRFRVRARAPRQRGASEMASRTFAVA